MHFVCTLCVCCTHVVFVVYMLSEYCVHVCCMHVVSVVCARCICCLDGVCVVYMVHAVLVFSFNKLGVWGELSLCVGS